MFLAPCHDPYDLWASPPGVAIRERFYARRLSGRIGAVTLGLADWLLPYLGRRIARARPLCYPIVVAHEVLRGGMKETTDKESRKDALRILRSIAAEKGAHGRWSWGLGFPWMSKNGLYGPDIPFVTHTPYVMEALLLLAEQNMYAEAMPLFHGTWAFLESLKVMHRGKDSLALSYAPVDEPRIVINANSYAALSYALHSIHGDENVRGKATMKAEKLACWVVRQQRQDGSWFYYADSDPGNFIDCFHSCFVVKNLLKVKRLLPDLTGGIDAAVARGWNYIASTLFDTRLGLCRRFGVRAQRDPFRLDLYDQAEFLGLLVDFGELEWARALVRQVDARFRKGGHWYCRIDLLGHRWGKDFLRWGIVPYLYHRARLERASERTTA